MGACSLTNINTLILISLLIVTTTSTPVSPSPQNAAGPLGSPAGSSPGTIPSGNNGGGDDSSSGSGSGSGPTQFGSNIRAVNTVMAVLCSLLTTSTYAVLIGPGSRLLSTSKLPMAAIETNIGNLLSATWPDKSTSTSTRPSGEYCQPSSSSSSSSSDAIRLLYAGSMDQDQDHDYRVGRGVEQCAAGPVERFPTPPLWLTTGSSLTRSIVQLAVWEWISIWMILAMLVSTLAFNGFLTNDLTQDSYPRLVIVLLYSIAFALHAWYVWKSCRNFFTVVTAGASWSLLHKASFVSVSLPQLERRVMQNADSPAFKQVGKPASSSTYPVAPTLLQQDVGGEIVATKEEKITDVQKSEASTVADWQKRDINSCVESGRLALDNIVANVMTMLGITITTGFAVWTSRADSTSESSQLGSLALLASLTLGTGAMFTSTIHLSVMNSAFRNVLFLKELMINGESSSHVSKRALKKRILGFIHGSIRHVPVGMGELMKLSTVGTMILFGPAYTLLPTAADHERQSTGVEYEFHASVRGKQVIFTTSKTDRHAEADDYPVEAINVFFNDHNASSVSMCDAKNPISVKSEGPISTDV
ncbi:hypothetical protein BGW36DRAFT_299950 [Talaromyces proteolyticus]|uniref:Uncharacterized protein n=1 Tax=Talaromyces proteolyticus TaxID=1131652 RepID=A0AAD4KMK8_9EURO|nr:uncharacterized protein BGW36DRAFT_299950 [Talaromyces proteolyticus]KAH8694944.1 hypothetical protein BGW36DRAFT_299950 [Talaromyces proteolyticus]